MNLGARENREREQSDRDLRHAFIIATAKEPSVRTAPDGALT
jgi:hypothetical protein